MRYCRKFINSCRRTTGTCLELSSRPYCTKIQRKNVFDIPMIPEELRKILFGVDMEPKLNGKSLKAAWKSIKSLLKLDSLDEQSDQQVPSTSDESGQRYDTFPELNGCNLSEHFTVIADDLTRNYAHLLKDFAALKENLPKMPDKWVCRKGWTKYDLKSGKHMSVPFPNDDIFVLDIEVCVPEGQHPIMATAVSQHSWYSWCSARLEADYLERRVKNPFDSLVTVDDLIPVETGLNDSYDTIDLRERIIIGHNVGFDRTFLREQYFVQGTKMRFFDTMSAHIAVSGLAGDQRIEYQYHKTGRLTKAYAEATEYDKRRKEENDSAKFHPAAWLESTSMNNLVDVYEFYCGKTTTLKINKEQRKVFLEGRLEDIKSNFQRLMTYCATDVAATFEVYKVLAGLFFERFPSPVTLCGMLEMSTSFLTVNKNWFHYLESADQTKRLEERRVKKLLAQQCDAACSLMQNKRYESDLWMFDENWSIHDKAVFTKKITKKRKGNDELLGTALENDVKLSWNDCKSRIKKNMPSLVGFPLWYRNLCQETKLSMKISNSAASCVDKIESWQQAGQKLFLMSGFDCGPASISVQKQVAPKLLRLLWDGFPLFYSSEHGWGFLMPTLESQRALDANPEPCLRILQGATFSNIRFPLKELIAFASSKSHICDNEKLSRKTHTLEKLGVAFAKLPHKDGPEYNVGNPLAKDLIRYIEENILSSENASHIHLLADLTKKCSYWKNNADRIHNLMVVWLTDSMASHRNSRYSNDVVGVILPRLVVAGTVTRRAVEPTWMTVSNAKKDRIGSELKGMIQAPDGYSFIGADVDSQEIWIAGLLADASKHKIHGATPFSYMLLKGSKVDGTDQHSVVAQRLGITRDQAKVINYGRFYGAGLSFAIRLLQQYRPSNSQESIRSLAMNLYRFTKGVRVGKNAKTNNIAVIGESSSNQTDNASVDSIWKNGSESELFNCLERIARSHNPVTPVLKCRISRSLEPDVVGEKFLPSRINWIIQSSAVDFLHSLLTCMRWLCSEYKINARFSLSVHDEVRYLVRDEDKYKAALALQLTNLLTRSFFVHSVGMRDLPLTVAYFSKVDIDKTFRKEVGDDCITPSNPLGLETCYNVSKGEALTMEQLVAKVGSQLRCD